MSKQAKSYGGQHFNPDEMIPYLMGAHKEENLLQLILYAHLFIEYGLTQKISEKLARPEILDGRWSFHQKLMLYVGLIDPPKEQEEQLFAFNRLRNRIAHRLEDEWECVWEFFPLKGEEDSKPDPLLHLFLTATSLLKSLGLIDLDQYIANE